MSPKQGRPASGSLQSYPSELRDKIYELRDKNPGWGAISILVELEHVLNYAPKNLPSADSVRRYLKDCGFINSKIPKSDAPEIKPPDVKHCHDLWEMDAQGAVPVFGLGYVSMINIKDSKSKTYVMSFPVQVKSRMSQPKTEHYLWALRLAFGQFGLPKTLQVDKDSVFKDNTSRSPFPSLVQLFLLGLGVDLSFIKAPPPAKQAMVERSHQTLDKQVLKGKTYQTWQELFINTNKRRGILNEKYPSRTLGKRAPLQVYPEAVYSKRSYSIEKETELFDFNRIEKHLAAYTWYRKVSSVKTLSLKKIYYLKKAKPKTHIQIKFCAVSKKLIFRNVNEQIIKELDAKGFAKSLLQLKNTQALLSMEKKIFENKNFPLE
jgi:hypothetical protein